MKYERFEDLPVWQAATDLAVRVFRWTRSRVFNDAGDLRSQLRRAALSVANNIAEGFERGTTAELLTFLYIARGSAGEVRSMLRFCERWWADEGPARGPELKSEISNLKSQISELRSLAESCSRQLRGWADALQNSDIAGQRRLTDRSRAEYDQKKRAAVFLEKLDEIVRDHRSEDPPPDTGHH